MTRTGWAVVLYVVSLAADLGGIGLIVRDVRRNTRRLAEWIGANPEGNAEGSWAQVSMLNRVVVDMLGGRPWRTVAVVLLVVGVVTGELRCPRCGDIIRPWQLWDLDHPHALHDGGHPLHAYPAHRACNRRAGGELAARNRHLAAQRRRAARIPGQPSTRW
jgi:hypothetical protein